MKERKRSPNTTVLGSMRSLNVLILEDNPTDALLIVRVLREAGFDLSWKRVATKSAYLEALADDYDVVLSDFALPQFDGLEALELLRERHLSTPFLLISGEINEETAVRAIKCGAHDYLLKDRLVRLGPAVIQALENRELQEQATQAALEKERLIQELAARVNQLTAIQQVFHILASDDKSDDAIFQGVADALPHGWRYPDLAAARLTIDGREFLSPDFADSPHKVSERLKANCGQHGLVEVVYAAPPPGENGELHLPRERQLLLTVSEMLRECLDQRHTQRLLSRDAMVLANVHDAAIVTNTDGVVTLWNEGAARLFGWTADEMLGRHYADRFDKDLRPFFEDQMQERLAGNDWVGEYEDWRKDGSRVWIDARVSRIIDDDGRVTGILGISRDISARKKAELELQQSEVRYRNIVESSHDLIWTFDEQGRITYMNQASHAIYGWTPQEMIGKAFLEFVAAEDAESAAASFAEIIETGVDTIDFTCDGCRKDGSAVPLATNARVMRDSDGNPVGVTGISRDMSSFDELVQSLRKRETLLANAERIADIGSWDFDIKNNHLQWSANTLRIFGVASDEFDGTFEAFLEKIHPEDRDRVLKSLAAADAGHGVLETEYRVQRGAGDERVLRERGEVSFDHTGTAIRRTGVVLDITNDVRNIEALRVSEERFHLALKGSAAGLWDWDMSNNVVFYSDRFLEMLGYSEQEFAPELASFFNILHPEDRSRVNAALEDHFRHHKTYDIVYRLRTKTKDYRWFHARGAVLRDESGQPFRMAGSLVDVTPQKRLEHNLIERERKQRDLADRLQEEQSRLAEAQAVAKVGSWETDLRTMEAVWSDETHRIFETDRKTFRPTHGAFLNLAHPEDRQSLAEALEASLKHTDVCKAKHRIQLPKGRIKHLEEVWRCFQDEQGQPIRAVGTCRDITAEVESQATLASHVRRLEAIALISRSLLGIRDITTTFSACADELSRHLNGRVHIWRLNHESQSLQLRATAGETDVSVEETKPVNADEPVARAARECRSIFNDPTGPRSTSQGHFANAACYAAIPLVNKEHCQGVIEIAAQSKLSSEERTGLEIIASAFALNLNRIRSEEEARLLNEQLEQRVKERTDELNESARRHETLLANLQGMAYRCRNDANGTLEYVSGGALALLGVEPGELIGSSLTAAGLIHPQDHATFAATFQTQLAAGSTIQNEYRIIQPNGLQKWVWEQARGVYDHEGEIEAIEGFITDVTSSKLSTVRERNQSKFYELLASETSLSACLEHIVQSAESEDTSIACFALMLDDSQSSLSLTAGPSLPSALRSLLSELRVRVDGEQWTVLPQANLDLGPRQQAAGRDNQTLDIVGLSGVCSHWVEPIRSSKDSAVLGTLNICSFHSQEADHRNRERLTWAANLVNLAVEHLTAKKAFAENAAFVRKTLDAISAHIAVVNSTGRIVTTNQAWRRFADDNCGRAEACCEGANYFTACDQTTDDGEVREIQAAIQAISRGELTEWDCEYPCHVGKETHWFLVRAKTFMIDQAPHFLFVHEDITPMKRTEEQLRKAAEDAKQANRAKSEFLATMSHELRTPLNGILGMNQLLLSSGLEDKQRRFAEASDVSGRALLNLINDILDLSKIEAGKLELDLRECNLRDIVIQVCTTMSHTAKQKGLQFHYELAPEFPKTAICDDNRIWQILINLVGNALKFTSRGGLTVKGDLASTSNKSERVRLEITDTGIGIPKDRQGKLFLPFSQVDSSTNRNFGGTGLGLAICQQLVELMEGEIGVESEAGRGSMFWFEVPIEIGGTTAALPDTAAASVDECKSHSVEHDRQQPHSVPALSGHILVAEDNHINQLYITELLRDLGCTCLLAGNGREAVARAAQGDFDLILMDCQMPQVDGFAATREIRKREMEQSPATRVPIVALTANALKGDRERCLAAGMDDYLSKPFELEAICAVLEKYLP